MRGFFIHIALLILPLIAGAQVLDAEIESRLADLPGITEKLQTFESFGVKEPGTLALENTGLWLRDYATQLGYVVEFDSFQDPLSRWQRNVVVTIPGTSTSRFMVLGAHYDTKRGTGTNDNGSGVVALMNTLEVLPDYRPLYGIRVVFFSGEEQGFHGSKHYVDSVLSKESGNLLLMLNVDQIGGTAGAEGNDKIYCERDENNEPASNNQRSKLVTDTLAQLTRLYTTLEPVISEAYSSDYEPFEDAGEIITGLYQFAPYPQTHTASDSLQYLDSNSLNQAVRLVTAATMYFSGRETLNLREHEMHELELFPNPASGLVICSGLPNDAIVEIYDLKGAKAAQKHITNGSFEVRGLPQGVYVITVPVDEKLFRARLVVQWLLN